MKQFHVISLSIGTALLLVAMSVFVVAGFVIVTLNVHPERSPATDVFRPKTGVAGEIEHTINELKYGPVNVQATKEVKNGLFDRIRARRQAQICQPCPTTTTTQTVTYYSAPEKQIVCEPTDCTYSYVVATKPVDAVIVSQLQPAVVVSGYEMPAIAPVNPIEAKSEECTTCRKDPRTELKTGSFLCSNCRHSQVGAWHTEWNADGTPVTFLCEACWQKMDDAQRHKAHKAYIARQSKSAGTQGLLHQEISQ